MAGSSLRDRREACVREHMDSENAHAFDVTMKTFAHPRCEPIGTGEVFDGEEEVWRYYRQSRAHFRTSATRSTPSTMPRTPSSSSRPPRHHLGPLRALPPTGRTFRARMSAFFRFEGDRIAVERIYFDSATILRQLGLSHDPQTLTGRLTTALTHPVTIVGAYGRKLLGRKQQAGTPLC